MISYGTENYSNTLFICRSTLDTKSQLLSVGKEEEILSLREKEVLRMLAKHVNEDVSLSIPKKEKMNSLKNFYHF